MNPKQKAFLAAYAVCGVLAEAARAAKVARRSHYDWMADPAYQAAFNDAEEEAIERLEFEARSRAETGVAEPVIYQGQLQFEPLRSKTTGQIRRDKKGNPLLSKTPLVVYKKSDVLLMFVLKSKRPERYRDNATVEYAGPGGGPLSVQVTFVTPKPTP